VTLGSRRRRLWRRQPVIDWVGARPMEGRAFTYTIEVDVTRSRPVRLVSVTRDE
jgi:hypothetical protein